MVLPVPAVIEGGVMTEPNGHDVCGAKTRSGGTCRHTAGANTGHLGVGRCYLHGGRSPQGELSGQLVLARQEATVMGRPLPIEPHEAILQCIAIAAGEVRYASERIAELDLGDAVGPVVTTHVRPLRHEKGADSTDETVQEIRHEAPALHIWITTRRQAMDRLVQYSATALKAGVEERRVRVAENVGQALADAIRGILTELGVASDPRTPAIVRKHLTLLSGQTVDGTAVEAA